MGAVIGPAIGAGIGAAAARSPILGAISGMGNVANQGLGAVQGVKVNTPFARVMEAMNAATADPSSATFANNVSTLPQAPTIKATARTQSNIPTNAPGDDWTDHIVNSAQRWGVDPQTALAVARTEGTTRGWIQSRAKNKAGVVEPSYGPFQMLVGGPGTGFPEGMGNQAMKERGIDVRDPRNAAAAIDFAMEQASKHGWGQWYGAAKAGIGDFQGIGGKPNPNLPLMGGGPVTSANAGTGVSASASAFRPQGGAVDTNTPMAFNTPGQTQGQQPQGSALERVVAALLEGGKGGTGPQAQMAEMAQTSPAVDLGAEEVAANQQALQQRLQAGVSGGAQNRKAGLRQRVGYKA